MSDGSRVTTPDAPPRAPAPTGAASRASSDGLEDYNRIAETVGGPSLRVKDNVVQAAIVIGCTALGAVAGGIGWGTLGAIGGGAGMMIVSTLISGLVLMVLGWVRASRPRR